MQRYNAHQADGIFFYSCVLKQLTLTHAYCTASLIILRSKKVVREDPLSLPCVPDLFVTQGQVKIWYNDGQYHDDDRLIKWYDGYKNARPRKHK